MPTRMFFLLYSNLLICAHSFLSSYPSVLLSFVLPSILPTSSSRPPIPTSSLLFSLPLLPSLLFIPYSPTFFPSVPASRYLSYLSLSLLSRREHIVQTILNNRVVVVSGDTGCGESQSKYCSSLLIPHRANASH
jgi:hypothetical protein